MGDKMVGSVTSYVDGFWIYLCECLRRPHDQELRQAAIEMVNLVRQVEA